MFGRELANFSEEISFALEKFRPEVSFEPEKFLTFLLTVTTQSNQLFFQNDRNRLIAVFKPIWIINL